MSASRICAAVFLALSLELPVRAGAVEPQTPAPDGVRILVGRLEEAAAAASTEGILALGDPGISRPSFEDFAYALTTPAPTRLVLNERDRVPMDDGGHRLIVEVFTEYGIEGRLGTWRLDVRGGATEPWRIAAVVRLSVITGLYRLSLNPGKQYDIQNLVVHAPDLVIEMASGRAFVAETGEGPAALVLLGRGRIHFSPADPAERTQVKIFSGDESLAADIDMAFLRLHPGEFASRVNAGALTARPVLPGDLRAATSIFNEHVGRALQVDLTDLSRDRWSLLPSPGDFIGELRTRKFGTLTYTRSRNEPEDITLFDRKQRHNISVYASAEKLAERGRFYSESDDADYDVVSYDIDAEFTPERGTMIGNATIRVRVSRGLSSLSFRLADSLAVRGVYSPAFGRLLHLRVVGQNSVIVNLPTVLNPGAELLLTVRYGGRITPQVFDREAIQVAQEVREPVYVPIEQRWLFSNRSYWYPQSSVTDYATARLRITVPAEFDVIATGEPVATPAATPGAARRRTPVLFDATSPSRYLAVVISRLDPVNSSRIMAGGRDVALHVQTSPRQGGRVRDMAGKAAAVFKFYASLVGDAPYPSFTLGLLESDRPGGHSPPYFAVLNQVVVGSAFMWRNDPVSFDNYPTFFLAHEVAHQWWGHAVGWKNYHEQWISEGFAQYFAALYAEKDLEQNVLPNLLRQMRHTAIAASAQGPVYLGYRLGHIRGDERVFRSVIYNKAAMVLHMLRRLVGDDAFFQGVRSFYEQWKFRKAGTDDFRQVMEKAAGRDLTRFFDVWIYGTTIPRVKFASHITAAEAVLRFEQRDEPVDVPVTVTVLYISGSTEEVIVTLADKVTERTLRLKGAVRSITANADNGALVVIEK
ncbi:MAG: hypothetical protein M3Q85_03425 [Acidobacteriota bacterium]|nr:hypothetical protein [Acidobacteriota bacterium]